MSNSPEENLKQVEDNIKQLYNASPTPPGREEGTDPTSGGAPATPSPSPNQGPTGAQVHPGKPAGRGGIVGAFLGNLVSDWQQERALKRELKRAQAVIEQSNQASVATPAASKEGVDSSEELLKQERNKRIRMISDFVEVKESLDHKVKRWAASAACFVVPWLLVIFLTSDVGAYFAGKPFTLADWTTAGIYGLVALLEIVIAVDTNAWGNTVHDINAVESAHDKARLRSMAWKQGIAWGILSLVSGMALYMFLMQQHADLAAQAAGTLASGVHAPIDYTLNAAHINVILRVIGTLCIDPACVFAVHVTTKNLDQFLKQQAQITEAITAISDSFDRQEEASARAEMRRKENERFLKLKSKMDDVNAEMFGKMGEKILAMSDQAFDRMQLPPGRIVDADDDDGRKVRRLPR
jgi:hypothetical protein